MSENNLFDALACTAIITVIIAFVYIPTPLKINTLLVYVGFFLASGFWIIRKITKKNKDSDVYLMGMGFMLQMMWTSIPNSLSWAWIGLILFIFYTFAFVITFGSEVKDAIHVKYCFCG